MWISVVTLSIGTKALQLFIIWCFLIVILNLVGHGTTRTPFSDIISVLLNQIRTL
jgi:hypothetical protein